MTMEETTLEICLATTIIMMLVEATMVHFQLQCRGPSKAHSNANASYQSFNAQFIAVCSAKGVPVETFSEFATNHIDSLVSEALHDASETQNGLDL